jgi:hypothetical protein
MKGIYLFNITLISVILLLVSLGYSQTIGCAVMPSKLELDFNKANTYNVEFRFWNTGDTDATYTIEPDDCLKNIIFDYERVFTVQKGTNITNPIVKYFKFRPDNTGDKTCYLNIWCSVGYNQSSMIAVKRGVASKILIAQPKLASPSKTPTSETSQKTFETSQNISEFQPKPSPQGDKNEESKITSQKEDKLNLPAQKQEKKEEKEEKPTITGMFVKFVTSPLFITIAIFVAIGFVIYKYRYLLPFYSFVILFLIFSIPTIYAQQEAEINVSVNVVPPAPPAPPAPVTAHAVLLGATTPTILIATLILYIFKEALGTNIKKIIKIIIVATVVILAISIYLSVVSLVI